MTDDINTLNEYLTENAPRFGLLDKETQKQLMEAYRDETQKSMRAYRAKRESESEPEPEPEPEPKPAEVQCDDATTLFLHATDRELMEIIANSAQELRERGYVPTLIPMTAPMPGEEDTRCRVILTRSFTSEHKRGKHD